MKFCFIGLGSIATRHIHNIKELMGDEITIDVLRSGKGKGINDSLLQKINHIFQEDTELDDRYDAIFITNPTSLHYKTLSLYKSKSNYFFIEKPVFETGTENIEPFINDGNTYYVACPLRYSKVIQYLKENIDFSDVYSMRCISSSYLPEWRENVDYRNTYSARKNMGGGVSIDLIHEWDYIYYLLGSPVKVKSIISKKSELEIDSDDIAVYIAEYSNTIVEVHLDYFGREAIRKIELFTQNDTIIADLINQKIEWLKKGKSICFSQERNEYQKKEISHFIDIINKKGICDNNLVKATKVLRITRGNL